MLALPDKLQEAGDCKQRLLLFQVLPGFVLKCDAGVAGFGLLLVWSLLG